jgi:branched-chain amino acid transport system permease protein|tara:strand:- start:151 stop:1521 length:1371 start_codon:yes stop_codon:yes gene_type:complete
MKFERYEWLAISIMFSLFILVGLIQGWSVSLVILNMCIISAIMTMGVNISWGYAGVINFGVMGFLAMGGLAAVIVSYPPITESWKVGGTGIGISFVLLVVLVISVMYINKAVKEKRNRYISNGIVIVFGILVIRFFYLNATANIEDVNPAIAGFLGGLGLPIIFSWIVGGFFAAGVAFIIGKVALGLRSDYLAIVTLGISEIVVSVLKHEEWLSRGVKNVIGLKRPVPYEINLQNTDWFISLITYINTSKLNNIIDVGDRDEALNKLIIEGSSIFVKLSYASLFFIVMFIIFYFANKAQLSPWGRMMRAIRDNEIAANAMGKDVVKQHLIIFVIGAAIVGVAGAMLVTLDGLFTPSAYRPLRFTFIIWIMVIVGGSGNNLGAIFGGFVIWFSWIEAAPLTTFIINQITTGLDANNPLRLHLLDSVPYFRYLLMGSILLLILRYRPKGIIPERVRHS